MTHDRRGWIEHAASAHDEGQVHAMSSPIYPKTCTWATYTHDQYCENVIEAPIRKLQQRGTYAPPPE
jgi:hypothetical protein